MKSSCKAVLPAGFQANGVSAGIKRSGKLDLALFYSDLPAKAACCFTANSVQAAPIQLNKRHLKIGSGFHSAENGKLGGRPPNKSTIEAQLFRNALAEHVAKKRDEYVRALDPLIFPPDGSKPNADAWAKVMDRSFGKPEQAVDVTSGGEKIEAGQQDPKALALLAEYEKRLRDEYEKP